MPVSWPADANEGLFGELDAPGGVDGGRDLAGLADVVRQEVPGLALILALDHVVLGGVDDAIRVIGQELAAVFVQILDVVAAAVVAVVVDDYGKFGVISPGLVATGAVFFFLCVLLAVMKLERKTEEKTEN